ncbi:hypothetical protein ILYODFUR_025578 [Ilyodon furcidens]|uniref:Secreted protein n=1 Tax=Ilyodon furcidens TaxID=33524 RepID=A0ABV0UK52_9TELE
MHTAWLVLGVSVCGRPSFHLIFFLNAHYNNTTFERAEVDLGLFSPLCAVCRLASQVGRGPSDRDLGWGWGLGGCLVLGLAFCLSQDRLDFLGSWSLASMPSLSVGGVLGSVEGVLAWQC